VHICVVTHTPNYMYTLGFSNPENQLFNIMYFFSAIPRTNMCVPCICLDSVIGRSSYSVFSFLCTCLDSVIREIQYFFLLCTCMNSVIRRVFFFVYMYGFSNQEIQFFRIFICRTVQASFFVRNQFLFLDLEIERLGNKYFSRCLLFSNLVIHIQ